MIEQFFLERGEEALHAGIVIAIPDAAEALGNAAVLQSLPEKSAGVLAATVGVEDGAAEREVACGGLKRIDTQLGTHIAVHAQGEDLSVETIHDR